MARWTNESRTPLAKLRANVGLTIMEAAVIMQLGYNTLLRYEKGLTDVPFGIGEQMSSLYKVPFETIRQAVLETKKIKGANTAGRPRKTTPKKVIAEIAE